MQPIPKRWIAFPLIAHLLAVILTLTILPSATAQTKTRKKPPADELATPKPKARPKPAPDPDANSADAPEKPKPLHATPAPTKTGKPKAEDDEAPPAKPPIAPNASIAPEEILEYHAQPAGVRKLIESCLDLARQNLTYTFGSADPATGGLDCSGFIYYTLRQYGLTQVPRDSSELYVWVRKTHGFRPVVSRKPDSFEMDELLPGDLLFWIGSYATDHDPPVTHTMIYLGTEKATGAKIMVGSSDGRTYHGQKRNGVSVFDFTMPRTPAAGDQRTTFIGYAHIPGLRD